MAASASMPISPAAAQPALAEHRIVRIEGRVMQDRYPRTVGRNAKLNSHGRGGSPRIRILETDQGVVGWAMANVDDSATQKFIGARVGDLFDAEAGTADEAMPLDKPLHDLAARILGAPVYALLGAKGPREVPVYSGAIYLDDLDPENNPRGIPAVIDCCRQDYDLGYRAFKLKIGRGFKWMPRPEGIQRDVDVTRAVRARFPDCRILVDANDGYTPDDFRGYVRAAADCDLYVIEEPFPEEREALLRLKETMEQAGCKALIADGEARKEAGGASAAEGEAKPTTRYGGYTREHMDRLYALAAEKLVHVFVIDLDIVGFTRWRRVMPELAAAGVQASPHAWACTARTYYTAQLAAGAGNVNIVEGIPGAIEGVDYSAYRFKDGNLVMPGAPGFGLELKR
ncbi:MAG: mandelate racemase [Candidatus Sumerlaeota bacterium]|nr:mandelate racemase [Candidatus Sumerlaeota bacterium]